MTSAKQELIDLARTFDEVEALIVHGALIALRYKRAPDEQIRKDLLRLMDRHREGKRILVSDLPAEWLSSEGDAA